jgi:hypothetical protein
LAEIIEIYAFQNFLIFGDKFWNFPNFWWKFLKFKAFWWKQSTFCRDFYRLFIPGRNFPSSLLIPLEEAPRSRNFPFLPKMGIIFHFLPEITQNLHFHWKFTDFWWKWLEFTAFSPKMVKMLSAPQKWANTW